MNRLIRNTALKIVCSCVAVVCFASSAVAFELLTEGAMGSVSAISANTPEELMSVTGAPGAGIEIDDDYEQLPFRARISLEGYEPEVDAQEELEFSLTQEIESWADELRASFNADFQLEVVDELPESAFPQNEVVIDLDLGDDIVIDIEDIGEIDADETLYQIGRVNQEVTKVEQGVDSVTYEVKRIVEQIRLENARPSVSGPAIGSTFITDLEANSRIAISNPR